MIWENLLYTVIGQCCQGAQIYSVAAMAVWKGKGASMTRDIGRRELVGRVAALVIGAIIGDVGGSPYERRPADVLALPLVQACPGPG